jgi:flagellar basal-body rod protein FlgG
MSGTIYKAASGALLMQQRLDILSNNLANVSTSGYKADRPEFRIPDTQSTQASDTAQPGLSPYSPPMSYHIDFSSGPFSQTRNPLDVAIQGDGFFEIQTDNGTQYTRKGNFSINDDGLLSTADGWPVMGQGGEITIESGRIDINTDGEVYVNGELADTLKIADFDKPYALTKTGDNQFVPADDTVAVKEGDNYTISQGFLEASNVNAIRTMTEVIETMRVFETYQKVINASDDATAKTVNDVGRKV